MLCAPMGYDWFYYLKKAWALYPGVLQPVSARVLAPHYARRQQRRGPLRAVVDAATGALFHLWIPWRAWRVQRLHGLDAAWRRRATHIARRTFADPNDLALFRIEHAEELSTYIRRFEDAALNKLLNPRGWTRDCALADKTRFAARCRATGLPHPPTVALLARRGVRHVEHPAGRELLVKPADGEGGGGVQVLGAVRDAAMLEDWHARLRPRGVLVVQPRIAAHPALRDLAMSALPTVRIVTLLDERGRPEVVSATFRCPTDPAAHIDNMKAGGLIAAVALPTGELGVACRGYGGGDHTHHPATGAAIAGRRLPDWEAARALVTRAHAQAFDDYVLIGWDVALTPEGPLLIEGNGKPGVLMPQRAARAGLAQGRYGALLAHHLGVVAALQSADQKNPTIPLHTPAPEETP